MADMTAKLRVEDIVKSAAGLGDPSATAVVCVWRLGRVTNGLERAAEVTLEHFSVMAKE